MISDLAYFYRGGVCYHKMQEIPYPEILKLHNHAERINKAREREANNGI